MSKYTNNVRLQMHHASGESNTSVHVTIEEDLPEDLSLQEYRDTFLLEGERLGSALLEHLPGGTVDQLLAYLLSKRAALLRVTLGGTDRSDL